MKTYLISLILTALTMVHTLAQKNFEKDVIPTSSGDLEITFIGHGTLMFRFNNLVIHADPVSREADYYTLPAADLILVTHHHGDHLDGEAIRRISGENTEIILTQTCADQLGYGKVMRNGESLAVKGLKIEAVPAYNVIHKRDSGEPFHPKGAGNGYIVNFADLRVYIAGDTENFPEMDDIKNINIAFLPMNLPFTMTPEMVAEAAGRLRPEILYPYHYGQTDTGKLLELMKNNPDCEVRIRKMQ